MPPSVGVPEKRPGGHQIDRRSKSGAFGATPGAAERSNIPSNNRSRIPHIDTDRHQPPAPGFLRTTSVSNVFNQRPGEYYRENTTGKVSNQLLGSSRAPSMNKDFDHTAPDSSRVKSLISELNKNPLVISRTKGLFTDLDVARRETAHRKSTGSLLPMYTGRLAVIPHDTDRGSGGAVLNNQPKPSSWQLLADDVIVKSERVRLPQKQMCTVLPPITIAQSSQQPKIESHASNLSQKTHLHQPSSKGQLFKAQSTKSNLPCNSLSENEVHCWTSEENDGQWQDEPLQTLHDGSCQAQVTVATGANFEINPGKQRADVQQMEPTTKSVEQNLSSKLRECPKIVAVQRKVPTSGYAYVPPSVKSYGKRNSPQKSRSFRTGSTRKSKTIKPPNKRSSNRWSILTPTECFRKICPCPQCSPNNSVLESALLYHSQNSPDASIEDIVMASCVNQYIESIFCGLDVNNTGFISEEQFVVLMRTLGCRVLSPEDKTKKISSVDFPKRLWQCWSQNHYGTSFQEKPRTRVPLILSILNSSSDIENMQNLTEQLEDINTSMKSASSSAGVEPSHQWQGLGQRLWENKQRNFARSKENRCLKSAIKKLRSALLRLGVENVILKVKLQLDSTGINNTRKTSLECSDAQNYVPVKGSVKSYGPNSTPSGQSNIENCTKCRIHQCPNVDLRSSGTEQERSQSFDSQSSSSNKDLYINVRRDKMALPNVNTDEMYLPMADFLNRKSPNNSIITDQGKRSSPEINVKKISEEISEPSYENTDGDFVRNFYKENPMYCRIVSINDEPNYVTIRRRKDSKPLNINLDEDVEEVSSFESDSESPFVRSSGDKWSLQGSGTSKGRGSRSNKPLRTSRIHRSKTNARQRHDCVPPPLPRRKCVVSRQMIATQQPTAFTNQGSQIYVEICASAPTIASKSIRGKNPQLSYLKSTDNLQKPRLQLFEPRQNYTAPHLLSQISQSSLRPCSLVSTEMLNHSTIHRDKVNIVDGGNSEAYKAGGRASSQPQAHPDATEDATRTSGQPQRAKHQATATDVLDQGRPRDTLTQRSTSAKSLLSLNAFRKPNSGRDPKSPKRTISGKNRGRALPELLATRALLLEALSVVRAAGGSPADDEIGFASHLGRKPKVEDDVLASTAASLKDKTTIARPSKIQKGSPLLETSNDGFIPESFVSKGEDENENIEQGLQEESEVNVKAVRQSAVNQEEATSVTSTTEGTPVVNPGRRRAHNSRASSRRRERNVRLPVITENVEVKPNVRLSLKLYESLRLDNLNITEDCPQDEVARESNNLTVDDILAEVMTYCRENDVPTKENHLNDFQDKNGEQQRKQPDLELIPTSQPDDKLTTNSELCLTYSETSSTKPVVSSHNTRIVNWKLQKHQQISQPSSQFALTSDSDDTSSLTTIGFSDDYLSTAHTMENKSRDDGCIHEAELDEVPDTYLSHGQALEDKPCSVGGGHESELEGCGQVEEQDDEGSVLLEDGCNSSCSSGSDSGRGESETSCPTPEEPLSCNSGGSDDGMWTAEDYSCLNHMTTSTDCHLQPETYQTDRSCYGKIQTNPRQASENSSTNTAEKFNFFTRNMDAKENVSSYYECGQAASSVLNNEKRSAIEPKAFLEESHYKKKQENSRKPGPMKFYVHEDYPTISVPNRSEALATLFEDYDNVDNCHNTDSSGVELGPELEIIDLNDETTSDQPMNNRDDTKKSKGFFGRRCTSFNTLRSFISNTTSHLKRNGQRRSSFSSSKSLPNYFSGTTAAPDLTSYSGTTQLKSIFKNNANKNDSNLKRNSSKRISFSDTIDVYPSSAKSFQVNAESKRSYRYPAGLEIPEYSPKRNLDLSRAAGKGADPLELSRDLDFGVSVQVQNAKDRTEICHSNEFDQNSRNESVPLPARDSFDFSDILSSLNDFKDEAQMTNSNRANSVAKNVVNLQQINETDTKRTRSQELDTMNQTSLYSFRQPPAGGTNYTFSQEKNEVSYLYPEHYSEHAAADHGGELTSATPAALTGPEKPSGAGSGQALLEALELELEDVLRSLEDEETELQ